jgi:carbon-monoxide dehydrogenase medium subunit
VYPPNFEYFAPATLDEALSTLEQFGGEGKVLAGGMSLIPVMKLRFAAPRALVDINRITGLDGLNADGGLTIGALVRGPFTTSLEPDEILTEVRVPDPGTRAGGTYLKLERKVGDFATVGVAVHVSFSNGSVGQAGIALTGVGPTNLRAEAAEQALAGHALDDDAISEAARLAGEGAQPRTDVRGSEDYKRNAVRILVARGLRKAAEVAA